jgi:hypothetical protein
MANNIRIRQALNGEFLPSTLSGTAVPNQRPSDNVAFGSVKYAHWRGDTDIAFVKKWDGIPPIVTSVASSHATTGTWPNISSLLNISWSIPTTSLIASFDVFVNSTCDTTAGIANQWNKINSTVLSNTTNSLVFTPNHTATGIYKFYVRSNGISGINTTSAESTGVTLSVPAAPTVLFTGTSASATTPYMSFTVGTVQKTFVDGVAGGAIAQASSTSSGLAKTSLSERTAYTYSMTYIDAKGFTSPAGSGSVTTLNAPPAAPSGTVSTSGISNASRTISMSWTASADADFLKIEVYTLASGGSWVLQGTYYSNSSADYTGFALNTYHTVLVRQWDNHGGYTDWSSTITTGDYNAPGTPTLAIAEGNDGNRLNVTTTTGTNTASYEVFYEILYFDWINGLYWGAETSLTTTSPSNNNVFGDSQTIRFRCRARYTKPGGANLDTWSLYYQITNGTAYVPAVYNSYQAAYTPSPTTAWGATTNVTQVCKNGTAIGSKYATKTADTTMVKANGIRARNLTYNPATTVTEVSNGGSSASRPTCYVINGTRIYHGNLNNGADAGAIDVAEGTAGNWGVGTSATATGWSTNNSTGISGSAWYQCSMEIRYKTYYAEVAAVSAGTYIVTNAVAKTSPGAVTTS